MKYGQTYRLKLVMDLFVGALVLGLVVIAMQGRGIPAEALPSAIRA